jgi:hypothetical protein
MSTLPLTPGEECPFFGGRLYTMKESAALNEWSTAEHKRVVAEVARYQEELFGKSVRPRHAWETKDVYEGNA